MSDLSLRHEVEAFLTSEARMLERNDLEAWQELFEPDGKYQIPTTDAPADARPETTQFFVADDRALLDARIARLLSRNAHAENPRSRTHRMVSNVEAEYDDAGDVIATASFVVHRVRDGRVDAYIGWYHHTLSKSEEAGFRFRVRKSVLAHEQLKPAGRLSFIL